MAKKPAKTVKRTVKRVKKKKKKKARKLTVKERLFLREYLRDFNATQAAIRAGYSESSAPATGSLLSRKHKARVDSAIEARESRTNITADRVLREIAIIALSDPTDVMEFGNGWVMVKDSCTLPHEVTGAISEISVTTSARGPSTMKVKFHSKSRMLELLCQHLGLMDKEGRMKDPEEVREMLDRLQNGDRDNATGIPANAD